MSTDLTRFRDHCRTMADPNAWAAAHPWPKGQSFACGAIDGHARCEWGWQTCNCACHDADRPLPPTAAEQQLWTRLADEVDTYLAQAPSQDPADHTEPIWETT